MIKCIGAIETDIPAALKGYSEVTMENHVWVNTKHRRIHYLTWGFKWHQVECYWRLGDYTDSNTVKLFARELKLVLRSLNIEQILAIMGEEPWSLSL